MLVAMVSGTLLAACASSDALRAVGLGPGNVGGVSADEPRAVIIAREILANKGTAADAAVALYFTTAVTFPASASLGAGGACLVADAEQETVESLEFPAILPRNADSNSRLKIAVPGAVRGMFALHARYGRLPWGQLLAPAEHAARLGHPMSRALATDLARVAEPLFNNFTIAKVFGRADGTPLGEGDILVQLELSAIISQLRTRGAGTFYSGAIARQIVDGVKGAGGVLTMDDMRGYQPVWRETLWLAHGGNLIHSVPPPLSGGVGLLQMWRMLTDDDRYADADPVERRHMLVEASMRTFADRATWRAGDVVNGWALIDESHVGQMMADYRPDRHTTADALSPSPTKHRESPSGTSFVVVDGNGSAVACSFTLNNFFGRGWMAPGTGIIMAAARSPERAAMTALAPVMMVNEHTGNFFFAAAASGGAAAPSALIEVMTRTLIDGANLAEAVSAPRLYHGGRPDVVVYETGEPAASLEGLRRRGHLVVQAPELGRVNAIFCAGGLDENPGNCAVSADHRGHGLASFVQFE